MKKNRRELRANGLGPGKGPATAKLKVRASSTTMVLCKKSGEEWRGLCREDSGFFPRDKAGCCAACAGPGGGDRGARL